VSVASVRKVKRKGLLKKGRHTVSMGKGQKKKRDIWRGREKRRTRVCKGKKLKRLHGAQPRKRPPSRKNHAAENKPKGLIRSTGGGKEGGDAFHCNIGNWARRLEGGKKKKKERQSPGGCREV